MSSITPDALREEIRVNGLAWIASVADDFTDLEAGTTPFSKVTISNVASTTAALQSFTGVSTLSGTADLTLTLAAGAAASFTTVGFVRVTLTDSGGNITDGDYYLPFGTLA